MKFALTTYSHPQAHCVVTFPSPSLLQPLPSPLLLHLPPLSCRLSVILLFFLLSSFFFAQSLFFFSFRASAMILEFCVQVPPTFRKQSKNGFFFQFSISVGVCVYVCSHLRNSSNKKYKKNEIKVESFSIALKEI